tara:strand:+ start:201 stop:389 length:189 start_codon:yes stop_codon:yes gene_type:complete
MNSTDYDKIIDKLLVFRGRLPVSGILSDKTAQYYADELRNQIDELIERIDWYADCDNKGLIK